MDSQHEDELSDSQLVKALNSDENMNVDESSSSFTNNDDDLTDSQLIQALQSYESKLSNLHY